MLINTPICDFGWQAPSFSLPDPSGQLFSSADLMGENGMVVAFICNHCPYVKAIINRLVADADTLKDAGVSLVAIMSNDYQRYPEDSPEKMSEFSRQHHMTFPYLIDETQQVARAFGAVCTPDFFGLNADGQLHYRGRLDDGGMAGEGRSQAELVDGMMQMMTTGTGPEHQIPSMGCSVKWRG